MLQSNDGDGSKNVHLMYQISNRNVSCIKLIDLTGSMYIINHVFATGFVALVIIVFLMIHSDNSFSYFKLIITTVQTLYCIVDILD